MLGFMIAWFARRPRIAVLLLGALLCALLILALASRVSHGLRVTFLDVGQGDAVLITAPSGRQLLYDGGPGTQVLAPLAAELPLFDRSLDMIVASHPDRDHIAGLVDVLARYRVAAYLEPGVRSENGTDAALLAAVHAEGAARYAARAGDMLDLGGGATVEMLFPDRDPSRMETNSASIVLRVRYGETALLLTGDLPSEIEEYLVSRYGEGLRAEVLKLGHHGSRTSTSDALLAATAPDVAVVSAGCDNRYGHPHREVLDRLDARGIGVRSTCTEGSITLESDGQAWMAR